MTTGPGPGGDERLDDPDGAEDARQLPADRVGGQRRDRGRVVDLGQDEPERRRLDRGRDDRVALLDGREERGAGVLLGRLTQAGGDAEDQVVLRLARTEEVAGDGEERIDVGVVTDLHRRDYASASMTPIVRSTLAYSRRSPVAMTSAISSVFVAG